MNYSVGQFVRIILPRSSGVTLGKTYQITKVDEDDSYLPVGVINDRGHEDWLYDNEFEVVADNAELAELRAFKARALARFPALAEPETDEEAAERIFRLYCQSGPMTVEEAITAAIAWARANPR